MSRILIVYGTTEGHTRKVTDRLVDWLVHRNHGVRVEDSANMNEWLDLREFDAFILAGSVHQARHQSALIHFAKSNVGSLQHKPSAFLSVSLTAALDDEDHQAEARQYIGKFIEETGWIPSMTTPVGGALKYSQYDFFKRLVVKMISVQIGGPSSVNQDQVYTNWPALEAFVDEFLTKLAPSDKPAAELQEVKS